VAGGHWKTGPLDNKTALQELEQYVNSFLLLTTFKLDLADTSSFILIDIHDKRLPFSYTWSHEHPLMNARGFIVEAALSNRVASF
jgi:hypothetical protein